MAQSSTKTREPAQRMFSTRNDIPKDKRTKAVALLNERLADSLDLYSQTKQAHWNVKGMDFHQLHLLFDELAETVEGHADLLAERATALGGIARGTVRMAAKHSTLSEMDDKAVEDVAFLEALCERYSDHGSKMREAIDKAESLEDKGTADVFTEIVRSIDKALYFLESHVQRAPSR